jgi:3-hydroxybutyryl-CoA dehydrogenase
MSDKVVVIGAGVMGRGIAHVSAMAGYRTILVDVSPAQIESAMEAIRANVRKGIDRGKVTQSQATSLEKNLSTSLDMLEASENAHFVIEAVPENIQLKSQLLAQIAEVVSEDTVLATNTSSLSVTQIASAVPHPSRVIGAHFFNPVHIVKLLEIITAEQTSDHTLQRLKELGHDLNREMIVVRDSPGFATSRLGLVIGLEAIRMLEEGVASAEDIDRAMELGYRHPMGPLKLTDLVGLDTRLKIAQYLYGKLGTEQFKPPALLERMVDQGRLGKKSGQGFYNW